MSIDDRPALPRRLVRYARRELRPVEDALHRAAQRAGGGDLDGPASRGRSLDRQWQWSACYAPRSSMYLDQFGRVRACCQNTDHLLGDLATSTLREIWDGARTAELRRALADDDLSRGCDFCAWQRQEAEPGAWFLRTYDALPADHRRAPRWPAQLEFSVSNTCNLQCVMCNGDWSSAIRSQREQRPPLPDAYPERFYEELRAFIPHLVSATFTGGEPFLGAAPRRIMDLLVELASPELQLSVVTNGTVWNERVERTLRSLRSWVTVSLDGGTAEVYERIRAGASFEAVLANLERMQDAVGSRGVAVQLSHCLMVDNWDTFPELLALAEERDLEVSVNVVRFPEERSLYQLPGDELGRIVAALERRTPEVEATVTGPRLATWRAQLVALGARSASPSRPHALGEVPVRLLPSDPDRDAHPPAHGPSVGSPP